jgi:nucleotide-binding universal stress UspA family protein/GNAT superfamily N-acetyltransferase
MSGDTPTRGDLAAIPRRARTIKLRDHSRVTLRPIAPQDKQLVANAFECLSDSSRYRRFGNVQPLTPETIAYLTEVDHIDHEAIIAIEPETGDALGVARYVRTHEDPAAAEVAVAVVDDWQGRGLGRALLTELTRRARREGIRRFVALVQSDNEEALKLMRGVTNLDGRTIGSQTELWIELPPTRGIGSQLAHVLRVAAATPFGGLSPIGWVSPNTPAPAPRPWLSIRTVVVGSDGSASAHVAVQAAADLAGRFAAVLHVVSAYREPEERTAALAALAAAEADLGARGLEPRCHARQADAATALADVAAAHSADVIVVGSKGMTGPAWLFGSVPSAVSRRAPCSVMIVRTG